MAIKTKYGWFKSRQTYIRFLNYLRYKHHGYDSKIVKGVDWSKVPNYSELHYARGSKPKW